MSATRRPPITRIRSTRTGRLDIAASVVAMLGLTTALVLGGMWPAMADAEADATALTAPHQIVHALHRLGYGPRPGDVERIRRMGLPQYIERQLHPETIDDAAAEALVARLPSLRMTTAELAAQYPDRTMVARALGLRWQAEATPETRPGRSEGASPSAQADHVERGAQSGHIHQQLLAYYAEHGLHPPPKVLQELQAQKLIRAVHSERQLLEVMVDFWFNHFNVFWGKGAERWLTTDFELRTIRPHALGKFKALLSATARSPAMLFYLDNFLSSSADAKRPGRASQPSGAGASEGGAAPLAVDRPRPAGSDARRQRPAGINENYARELLELHTLGVDGGYTQQDVHEVARCFTGWTIEQPRRGARFVFRGWMHDDGEKTVLGHRIPAGGGIEDGERVIDILARHPSTARFIATKLVRRFVSDEPPPALVDSVAAVYANTDGDIRAMLRTIFASAEFWAPAAHRAKIKSPLELAASAIRAMDGHTDGSPQLARWVARMGQPLYLHRQPTGYADRAEPWVNTGALLARLNFGLALAANRIPGTVVDPARLAAGLDPADGARLLDRAIDLLLHGDLSPQRRAILDRQLRAEVPQEGSGASGRHGEAAAVDALVARAFGLVLGSPEFQRR
jgi:uncharacterized protein (DUF1800 family)